MITVNEMQYGGMLTMALLALTLVWQVPQRLVRGTVFSRARWMMAGGLALLAVHFLLQYITGFRQMGITQAVMWNLLFFIPCSWLFSIAVLYMQRQGQLRRMDWWVGAVICIVSALILIVTATADGVPFKEESKALRTAEYVSAGLYVVMQLYYFVNEYREYRRMRRAVEEYYDHECSDMLAWMGHSVKLLTVLALFAPFVIFAESWWLTAYACAFFLTIYYFASSFHSYGISLDAHYVEEASKSQLSDESEAQAAAPATANLSETSETEGVVLSEDDKQRMEQAAQQWAESGAYRQPNLTLSIVANEMNVQRYMLKAWLQQSEYGKLSNWLNRLRIAEAQRFMNTHPDWTLDAVAEHCGLSLSSFHRVFHEITGVTPAKFLKGDK